ncbi:hypothetical protein ACJX0J_022556, partial [Zea mays]
YQFSNVFDWTILKYPQIGSNLQTRVGERTSGVAGPSMDKMEKAPGEVFGRRNPSSPVNQTDSYAQQPHETVSMSLKEI